jgi:tetratricopeptide (TPR) repeat protein
MGLRGRAVTVVTVTLLAMTLSACDRIASLQAKQTLKDANTLYQAQNYRGAVAKYEEVLQRDPSQSVVYFYLANSYDNLYRPNKPGAAPEPAMLDKAIANYKIAIERAPDPQMKKLSLQYLVAAYGPDKLDDPSQAEPILQEMIKLDPSDTAAYFVLARIYEDAGNLDESEAVLLKAKEAQPKQSVAYQQLAGYYQRQGDFPKVIETIQQRALLEPNNPEVHYSIASYYWDEAYRNTRLADAQKREYAQKGLESVDRALAVKPDYVEAIVYRGLLLRVQAGLEKDAKRQQELLSQATALQEKAADLKKKQAAGV